MQIHSVTDRQTDHGDGPIAACFI